MDHPARARPPRLPLHDAAPRVVRGRARPPPPRRRVRRPAPLAPRRVAGAPRGGVAVGRRRVAPVRQLRLRGGADVGGGGRRQPLDGGAEERGGRRRRRRRRLVSRHHRRRRRRRRRRARANINNSTVFQLGWA